MMDKNEKTRGKKCLLAQKLVKSSAYTNHTLQIMPLFHRRQHVHFNKF